MTKKHCKWCDQSFDTKVSYQIYCSPACRDSATREKIAERYQIARRTRRKSKPRQCKSCKASLSVYNDDTLCQQCSIDPSEVLKALKEMKGMANGKDRKN